MRGGGGAWGPDASASPPHLVGMLRSDVSLDRKGRQLIDAQQPEERGGLRTAARKVPDGA